jgi:hypothetical protein
MSTFIIKMLSDQRGSDNGFNVRLFHKDEVLQVGKDIGDSLARRFIARECATEISGTQYVSTGNGGAYAI